jgi:hypothetical protein
MNPIFVFENAKTRWSESSSQKDLARNVVVVEHPMHPKSAAAMVFQNTGYSRHTFDS